MMGVSKCKGKTTDVLGGTGEEDDSDHSSLSFAHKSLKSNTRNEVEFG